MVVGETHHFRKPPYSSCNVIFIQVQLAARGSAIANGLVRGRYLPIDDGFPWDGRYIYLYIYRFKTTKVVGKHTIHGNPMGFIHFISVYWKEGFQFQYYCIGIRPHLPVGFASFLCECNSHA